MKNMLRLYLSRLLSGCVLVALIMPLSVLARVNIEEEPARAKGIVAFSSEVVNGQLYFKGKISPAAYAVFDKYLASGGKSIVITSGGGDVSTSIGIARRLRSSDAEVIVKDFCISSCANYLFIGAVRKWLPAGAFLGFHGAPVFDSELTETDRNLPAGLREIYLLNEDFLKDFGVNRALFHKSHELTRLDAPILTFTISSGNNEWKYETIELAAGGLKKCRLQFHNCQISVHSQSNSSMKVYFPSRMTLEKFGVVGIVEYSYPATKQSVRELANGFTGNLNLIGDFP